MALLKLNNSDPRYYQYFGNHDLRHFTVYINQNEQIGKVIDVLIDDASSFIYLVVNLFDKQVLIPLGQTQVVPERQGIYLTGISKSQVVSLPPYNPVQSATSMGTPASTQQNTVARPYQSTEKAVGNTYSNSSVSNSPVSSQMASDERIASSSVATPASFAPSSEQLDRSQRSDHLVSPAAAQFDPAATESIVRDFLQTAPSDFDEDTIRLLQERLVVDREKHKIGEVIVRKEVETRMVEVPVRREKLIVEQINPERKQLAEIDLSSLKQTSESNVQLVADNQTHNQSDRPLSSRSASAVSGDFSSARAASQFLQAIADRPDANQGTIHVSIETSDPELRDTYQQWLTRYSEIH
ncbi:MAG TPA: PRC and DUF2382 domain-containing protein [Crinalium sp.]|jgi:stress response protein YsnF